MDSISELRKNCQVNAIACRYRIVSIYFTKAFLMTSITPNQITLLSLVFGLSGAILLAFNNAFISVISVLFLHLFFILDCSDGEVARYRKMVSPGGMYFERMCHQMINPTIFIALGFRLYNGSFSMFLLAAVVAFSVFLNNIADLYNRVISSKSVDTDFFESTPPKKTGRSIRSIIIRSIQFSYSIYTVVDIISIAVLLQVVLELMGVNFVSIWYNPFFYLLAFYAIFYSVSFVVRILVAFNRLNKTG